MTVTKQVTLHGDKAYITDGEVLVGKGAVGSGGTDQPTIIMPGSPNYVAVWEDFLDTGAALEGWHDTGSAAHAVVAATNGVYRITPAASQVGDPSTLTGNLSWKVNQGKGAHAGALRLVARVKKSVYTGGEHGLFVGFTDVLGAEMPVHDTGGTADKATATNAFGFAFNVSGDTGWMGYAVDGDTVQETSLEATTPTDNVWVTLELEAHRGSGDTGGTVSFSIDGVPKGSIDNPCNISTALTPVVAVYDTGGASTVDVDYINVSAPRDTGT